MLLKRFAVELDRQGLPVPAGSERIARSIRAYEKEFESSLVVASEEFEWEVCTELLSLAQHYEIPTRLLDWTRSAFIAAYFAAVDESMVSTMNLAVWVLHTQTPRLTSLDPQNLRIVEVPLNASPNIHAQDGVFTLFTSDGRLFDKTSPIDAAPLERWIERVNASSNYAAEHTFLYKFTVPRLERSKILRLLEKEGVTASRLFPGYYGVARRVREYTLSSRE